MKILAATNNAGKVREIKNILSAENIEVVSLKEVGISIDPEENGNTFEENALIKARAVAKVSGMPTISDDSGLCVDYLDGAPGIYSARYAGEGATDAQRIAKLLAEMKGVEQAQRKAFFISAAAYVHPDGTELTAVGTVDGYISEAADGEGGFGYDPIFYSTELRKTFAAMSETEKNKISHRFRALTNLKAKMIKFGVFQGDK